MVIGKSLIGDIEAVSDFGVNGCVGSKAKQSKGYYERSVLVSESQFERRKSSRRMSARKTKVKYGGRRSSVAKRSHRSRSRTRNKRKRRFKVIEKDYAKSEINIIAYSCGRKGPVLQPVRPVLCLEGSLTANCQNLDLSKSSQKGQLLMLNNEDKPNDPCPQPSFRKVDSPKSKKKRAKRNMAVSLRKALMEDKDSIDIEQYLNSMGEKKRKEKQSISKKMKNIFNSAKTPLESIEFDRIPYKDITNTSIKNEKSKEDALNSIEQSGLGKMIKNANVDDLSEMENCKLSDKDFELSSIDIDKKLKFNSLSLQFQPVKQSQEKNGVVNPYASLDLKGKGLMEKSEIKLSTPFDLTNENTPFKIVNEDKEKEEKVNEMAQSEDIFGHFFTQIELKEAFKAPYPNCKQPP